MSEQHQHSQSQSQRALHAADIWWDMDFCDQGHKWDGSSRSLLGTRPPEKSRGQSSKKKKENAATSSASFSFRKSRIKPKPTTDCFEVDEIIDIGERFATTTSNGDADIETEATCQSSTRHSATIEQDDRTLLEGSSHPLLPSSSNGSSRIKSKSFRIRQRAMPFTESVSTIDTFGSSAPKMEDSFANSVDSNASNIAFGLLEQAKRRSEFRATRKPKSTGNLFVDECWEPLKKREKIRSSSRRDKKHKSTSILFMDDDDFNELRNEKEKEKKKSRNSSRKHKSTSSLDVDNDYELRKKENKKKKKNSLSSQTNYTKPKSTNILVLDKNCEYRKDRKKKKKKTSSSSRKISSSKSKSISNLAFHESLKPHRNDVDKTTSLSRKSSSSKPKSTSNLVFHESLKTHKMKKKKKKVPSPPPEETRKPKSTSSLGMNRLWRGPTNNWWEKEDNRSTDTTISLSSLSFEHIDEFSTIDLTGEGNKLRRQQSLSNSQTSLSIGDIFSDDDDEAEVFEDTTPDLPDLMTMINHQRWEENTMKERKSLRCLNVMDESRSHSKKKGQLTSLVERAIAISSAGRGSKKKLVGGDTTTKNDVRGNENAYNNKRNRHCDVNGKNNRSLDFQRQGWGSLQDEDFAPLCEDGTEETSSESVSYGDDKEESVANDNKMDEWDLDLFESINWETSGQSDRYLQLVPASLKNIHETAPEGKQERSRTANRNKLKRSKSSNVIKGKSSSTSFSSKKRSSQSSRNIMSVPAELNDAAGTRTPEDENKINASVKKSKSKSKDDRTSKKILSSSSKQRSSTASSKPSRKEKLLSFNEPKYQYTGDMADSTGDSRKKKSASSSKKRGSASSRKLMTVPEALNDAPRTIGRKKEKRSSSGKKSKSKSRLPSNMVRSASSKKSLSVPVTLNGITLNGTITTVAGKTKESAKIPKAPVACVAPAGTNQLSDLEAQGLELRDRLKTLRAACNVLDSHQFPQ